MKNINSILMEEYDNIIPQEPIKSDELKSLIPDEMVTKEKEKQTLINCNIRTINQLIRYNATQLQNGEGIIKDKPLNYDGIHEGSIIDETIKAFDKAGFILTYTHGSHYMLTLRKKDAI